MTDSKERMLKVFAGERVQPPPAVLHSWGDYKVELAGHHHKFQYYLGGADLADVDGGFYERFGPDWMHLGSGSSHEFRKRQRKVENGRAFIASADASRWIEIRDDFSLADYDDVSWAAPDRPRLRFESRSEIDDFYAASRYTADDVIASGRFDHISIIAREYGDRVLVVINDGAPGCGIRNHSFEDAMVACVHDPNLVAYCIFKDCELFLEDVRAAKACGADAYIFSEGFGGSLDMLSPEMHERLEMDAKRWFYSEVRKIGMCGIGYWLGDVRPNMRLINSLDMPALMIEESKKGFILDPVEIRQQLRPDICLIGNVDSALILHGTPDRIRDEVRRQKQAVEHGPFVTANGSPLIIGTPTANIEAFLDEARR